MRSKQIAQKTHIKASKPSSSAFKKLTSSPSNPTMASAGIPLLLDLNDAMEVPNCEASFPAHTLQHVNHQPAEKFLDEHAPELSLQLGTKSAFVVKHQPIAVSISDKV